MKLKDLMSVPEQYLRPDMSIKDAVNLLDTSRLMGVMGLPVTDRDGKLVGMLSLMDILQAVFPSYLALWDLGRFTWEGMVEKQAKDIAVKRVDELMTGNVVALHEDDPTMECIDLMIKNRFRSFPVVDDDNRVIGVVYQMDVFHRIVNAIKES